MGPSVQGLPDEERQLVGVLNRGGNADSARPIVVEVAHHVRQTLEFIHVQTHTSIRTNVEIHRIDRPLTDVLRDEKEVATILICHATVNYSS